MERKWKDNETGKQNERDEKDEKQERKWKDDETGKQNEWDKKDEKLERKDRKSVV